MKLRIDPTNYDACPAYNEWIDEQYIDEAGPLTILGFEVRPSLVLHTLSLDTYQAAFDDFQRQRQETLKQIIFEQFPSPVARNCSPLCGSVTQA